MYILNRWVDHSHPSSRTLLLCGLCISVASVQSAYQCCKILELEAFFVSL